MPKLAPACFGQFKRESCKRCKSARECERATEAALIKGGNLFEKPQPATRPAGKK